WPSSFVLTFSTPLDPYPTSGFKKTGKQSTSSRDLYIFGTRMLSLNSSYVLLFERQVSVTSFVGAITLHPSSSSLSFKKAITASIAGYTASLLFSLIKSLNWSTNPSSLKNGKPEK